MTPLTKGSDSTWSRFPPCESLGFLRALAIVTLILVLALEGLAEENDSKVEVPWEPEEVSVDVPHRLRPPPPALLKSLARPAIHFYRRRIAVQSIDRCPFHISCSNFAERAVERFGLVRGVALFIDRHYFREHSGALHLYPLREARRNDRIRLKLDDSFFLSEKRDVAR